MQERTGRNVKCVNCGRDNPAESKYCSGCGQPLAQQIPDSQKPSGATQAEKYAAKSAGKKRRIAALCGVWSVALLALLALLIGRSAMKKDAQEPSTALSASAEATQAAAQPAPAEWSGWVDELPAGVSDGQYEIETQTLYRSREKETTTASQELLPGWELSSVSKGDGSFGAWSEWSPDAVSATREREVETQTRYRYRNRETTTSASSALSGWTQYDVSYAWSDYGAWSDWSTGYVSSSDSRMVESKTQYRCRDISYVQRYTDWSGWSGWQSDPVSSDSLTDVQTRTVYGYYWYQCPNCGAHMHGWGFTCPTWAGGCGKARLESEHWHTLWSTTPPSSVSFGDWYGTTHYYAYVDGVLVFRWDYGNPGPQTQYSYRTRSTYQETNYGSWSGWGDAYYSSSSTREVESRTVYRYCDRAQTATYHYYRWTDWSGWSTTETFANNDRQVETATYYRYRDKEYEPVYYFFRWTDWSEWSTDAISASDTVDVELKHQYRYRLK